MGVDKTQHLPGRDQREILVSNLLAISDKTQFKESKKKKKIFFFLRKKRKVRNLTFLLSWSFQGVSTSGIAGSRVPDAAIGLSPHRPHSQFCLCLSQRMVLLEFSCSVG